MDQRSLLLLAFTKYRKRLTLIPANIFVMKTLPAAYIQMLFKLDFIMEAITMNPDQTALLGSSLIWIHNVC